MTHDRRDALKAIRILALVLSCASLSGAAVSAQKTETREDRLKASVARVYDTRVLHRIEIVIAPQDAAKIQDRATERVRCTFSFDGLVLKDVGVRQAGGSFNPREIRLKDEVEKGRSRKELLGAAEAVQNAYPETFVAAVSRYLDLDRYITFYAVEAATSNYDGFSFNVNNAYLYAHSRVGAQNRSNQCRRAKVSQLSSGDRSFH